MRLIVVMTAALLLAGCDSASGWLGETDSDAFPPDRPAAMSVASADDAGKPLDRVCDDAARARSNDVANQGFDDAVVQTVYQQTYADCAKWETRH